jgi:hypothetical protein
MRILTRRDTGLLTQWTFGTAAIPDPDAQAFISAAGITDSTQQSAIFALVASLKSASLWTKFNAVYPFVGGSASSHKFNLINPADTNAAFRLNFVGGWTHSANGATPNGTNGYADSFFNTTNLSNNSGHLSYYSRTNSGVINEIVMGNLNDTNGGNGLNLIVRRNTNLISFRATELGAATGLVDSTTTDGRGMAIGSITSSASRKIYRNGSLLNTNTTNVNYSRANATTLIAAAYITNTASAGFYTNKECAFASIGAGLNDTEAADLYTAVQTFQTTLGRQV